MARGRNCRLCMKNTIRSDSTTINNFPRAFAHILEEQSGIKFTEADGLQINVCLRCRDFLQAMENNSRENKISGAGKRKVRRLMDKGISSTDAIKKVMAAKRARDLVTGTGLPVQQNQNLQVQNLLNTQLIGDIQGRRMTFSQRKKYSKLVGGGMDADQARLLVLASGLVDSATKPQRGPAVGPVQGRIAKGNVVQRPNGPRPVIRNTVVQVSRAQKLAKGLLAGATQRLQRAGGVVRGPLQKTLPQKAGKRPVQKTPIQKGAIQKKAVVGANQTAPIQKKPVGANPGAPVQKKAVVGANQKAPLKKKLVPNMPANNPHPKQRQGNVAGGKPIHTDNRPERAPRRNDRPAPYNNNNRGNDNRQNQNGPRKDNFNQNCPLEVGIVPINFPNVQLDEMKLEALKEAITNEIFKIPQGGPLIRFLGTSFENGWLKLICADQLSHNWLASLVSRWERAGVRLVEGNSLPQPVVLSVYLAGDFRSPEEILNILEKQNNSLQTAQWRIINRETDPNGQSITVCVDEHSFQALQSRDFMVFLGLGVVEFKPRRFPTDGGTFNNSNMRGQSTNNNPNKNNNMNNSRNANNSMGYSNGGYSNSGNNNMGGGGGGGGMGNQNRSNQNRSNNAGGGSNQNRSNNSGGGSNVNRSNNSGGGSNQNRSNNAGGGSNQNRSNNAGGGSNQNRSNNAGGGSYNRPVLSQGQGYQRSGYQNQRSW